MLRIERWIQGDPGRETKVLMAGAALLVVLGAGLGSLVHPLVGIAAVVGALVAPFILRDIDLAFIAVVAVILLLPFAALPIGIGFNPTFLDLTLGVLYLIWLMRLVQREQTRLQLPPLWAGMLLFIGIAFAALFAGMGHGRPTNNQFRVFGELVLGAGLFFVIANLIEDRASLKRIFQSLVGLGFLAALIGLGLYVLPDALEMRILSALRVVNYPEGPGVLRYLNDDPSRLQRAVGTSIDPNSFGGMLAAMTALLLPQALSRKPLISRRWTIGMCSVMVLALLATVSRGSMLGFAAALCVIGLFRDRRMLALAIVGGFGLIAVAQVLPWTSAYVDHFSDGLRMEDRASVMRLGEYKDAFTLIQRYPALGVGFGSPSNIDLYRGVSSLYLIIAETMGLLGLGAFLMLMAGACLHILMGWHRAPPDGMRAVLLGCIAAIAAAMTSGLFDHYFFTYPHAFALLWLIVGLAMRTVELAGNEAEV